MLVIACYSFPYVFVFTKSALDLISSEMEDAANILGAGNLRTTLSITLPLVLPAILGAFILVFLEAIALFGVARAARAAGALPRVTTQLWQFFEFPPKVERGGRVLDAASVHHRAAVLAAAAHHRAARATCP